MLKRKIFKILNFICLSIISIILLYTTTIYAHGSKKKNWHDYWPYDNEIVTDINNIDNNTYIILNNSNNNTITINNQNIISDNDNYQSVSGGLPYYTVPYYWNDFYSHHSCGCCSYNYFDDYSPIYAYPVNTFYNPAGSYMPNYSISANIFNDGNFNNSFLNEIFYDDFWY